MGKGSKQRPMQVDEKTFSDNWARAFMKDPVDADMWTHYCAINGTHLVGKGEHCNWCGENEQGDLDYDMSTRTE